MEIPFSIGLIGAGLLSGGVAIFLGIAIFIGAFMLALWQDN